MQVADGEVRAVIGPNGAGKTTLFHLITGVVKPTTGRVRFADHDITGRPRPDLPAGAVTHVPAHALFPEMSARDNAMLAAQARRSAALAAIRRQRHLRPGPQHRRPCARAARVRRMSRTGLPACWPRRPAPSRGGDGDGAASKVLLLDEPTQGSLSRDRAGRRDAGGLSRTRPHHRAAGGARHGGRVPAGHKITVLHRGGVIADGRQRPLRPTRGCRSLSRGHRVMLRSRAQHALRCEPHPARRRPRAAEGPHCRRARPQRRWQDDDGRPHGPGRRRAAGL